MGGQILGYNSYLPKRYSPDPGVGSIVTPNRTLKNKENKAIKRSNYDELDPKVYSTYKSPAETLVM